MSHTKDTKATRESCATFTFSTNLGTHSNEDWALPTLASYPSRGGDGAAPALNATLATPCCIRVHCSTQYHLQRQVQLVVLCTLSSTVRTRRSHTLDSVAEMAGAGLATPLLVLNFIWYLIAICFAGWALNRNFDAGVG